MSTNDLPVFRGMMPLMPTAITESGELDLTSQRRLVQYCLKCGAVAIGHFGFASEFHKLSETDRRRLTETIVDETAGRAPVFIGVAAPAVHVAVEYAKEAEALGADLIMATLPYIDLPDEAGSFAYFQALSDATALPIIIQDTPLTSPILTAEVMVRMFREIEHIQYVKAEGKSFLAKTAAVRDLSNGELPVIGGAGGKHLLHFLRIGVTAFMTGTEALDLHAGALRAYLEGNEEEAARIYYDRILPYFMFYNDFGEELLKAILHRRGVIDCPKVIDPPAAAPMSEVEWREFEWVLERVGLNTKWPDIP